MYVMVIEDYYNEEYLGNVREKESIINYKTRYWGYTEPMNVRDTANMIEASAYANWYGVIDLDRMEFLTEEEEENIIKQYCTKGLPEIESKWFFEQFNYNEENSQK